ncbi:ATP-binding protein [Adlercreutzia equolifaciens]|uniref:ATP-binding protein n=1 Tax=Adlercreutzia equolifaciens TaxID=446660 RepID=UPI003A94EFCD
MNVEDLVNERGAEATRVLNYPFATVEEVLSNAVYHRSYQINEPITVRITPDGIEVTSFPGFDRSISDQAVRDRTIRARSYRNRRIGDFLKELHLIEGRNTGFPTAYRALEENGSDPLVFESDENRGFLSVTIPVHPAFAPVDARDEKRAAYAEKILEVLSGGELSLTDLARELGYKGITKKLRDSVELLVRDGRVERVVAEKGAVALRVAR